MPAPMMAPMPRAVRETGPSVRLRVCSPDSWDSCSSISMGFFANSGFPMRRLSLLKFASPLDWGSVCVTRGPVLRLSPPKQIDWYADQDNNQTRPSRLRFIKDQREHDHRRRNDVQDGNNRVAECPVRPLGVGPFTPKDEQPSDGQHEEDQHGKDNVIKKVAVEIAVPLYPRARIDDPGARQHQHRRPDTLQDQPH